MQRQSLQWQTCYKESSQTMLDPCRDSFLVKKMSTPNLYAFRQDNPSTTYVFVYNVFQHSEICCQDSCQECGEWMKKGWSHFSSIAVKHLLVPSQGIPWWSHLITDVTWEGKSSKMDRLNVDDNVTALTLLSTLLANICNPFLAIGKRVFLHHWSHSFVQLLHLIWK